MDTVTVAGCLTRYACGHLINKLMHCGALSVVFREAETWGWFDFLATAQINATALKCYTAALCIFCSNSDRISFQGSLKICDNISRNSTDFTIMLDILK